MIAENSIDLQKSIDLEEELRSETPLSPSFLSEEELLSAIRKQVEYYFSKENLQQDAYLRSHMDSNMSVPTSVVMTFAKMKALTNDEKLLQKALESSSVSVIQGNRIKANVKVVGRSTIILREIPPDTPPEEVKEIFDFEGCKSIVSMRSDIGDTWFVTLESEEDAKDTLIDLRVKKRLFRGQPVKARMKTETTVRSFYPIPTAAPILYPNMVMPIVGTPMMPPPMFGFGMIPGLPTMPPILGFPVINVNGQDSIPTDQPTFIVPLDAKVKESYNNANSSEGSGSNVENKPNLQNSGTSKNGLTKSGMTKSTSSQSAKDANSSAKPSNRKGNSVNGNGGNQSSGAGNPGVINGVSSKKQKGSTGKKSDHANSSGVNGANGHKLQSIAPPIEISAANFPPLAPSVPDDNNTPIPTAGYKGPYNKYSLDDIINIVKNIHVANLPDTVRPADHPLAMTTTANTDLLRRQRSRSIEETRELLRQGRPVQREAISEGAVDYGNMMYGDGYDSQPIAADKDDSKVIPVYSSHHITNIPFSQGASTWAAMVTKSSAATANATPVTGMKSSGTKPKTTPDNSNKKGGSKTDSAAKKSQHSTSGDKSENNSNSDNKKNRSKENLSVDQDNTKVSDHNIHNANGVNEQLTQTSSPIVSHSLINTPIIPSSLVPMGTDVSTLDVEINFTSLSEPELITISNTTAIGSSEEQTSRTDQETPDEIITSNQSNGPGGWGGKPTFANILKLQQTSQSNESLIEMSAPQVTTLSLPVKSHGSGVNKLITNSSNESSTNELKGGHKHSQWDNSLNHGPKKSSNGDHQTKSNLNSKNKSNENFDKSELHAAGSSGDQHFDDGNKSWRNTNVTIVSSSSFSSQISSQVHTTSISNKSILVEVDPVAITSDKNEISSTSSSPILKENKSS